MGKLKIQAKCSDLCFITFTDDEGKVVEHNGYVPQNIGIGGGDYIELEIDTVTGIVSTASQMTDVDIIDALEEMR